MSIFSQHSIKENERNLAKPGNLLLTMSSNGKENTKTLDNIFRKKITKNSSCNEISAALRRTDSKNVIQAKVHNIKFTWAMHMRNQNRSYCTFII